MGLLAKVHTTASTYGEPSLVERPRPSPSDLRRLNARNKLLFFWLGVVALPWLLQIRSFMALAMRHKITQKLIPSEGATLVKSPTEVTARCPARGTILAGTWFSYFPTHFYESSGSVLCHFVIPQYNAHGMYHIDTHKTLAASSAPRSCANDSYATDYYFYHGSIGYYALYAEGEGVYCSHERTAYTVTTAVGSKDINFNSLAKNNGAPGYHSSYYFSFVGAVWLAYRMLVVSRSFRSCSRYGRQLDGLREPLSLSSAVVYVQQAARLAPHSATNWHRIGLLYLLAEGLMTDLFLLIAYDGYGTKIQYISLGYNVSGLLSMLFEIVENTTLLKPSALLLIKRVLFNSELTLWGELLFSIGFQHYFTGLNRSDLGPTRKVAEAISYYAWGLVNHAVIVLGQSACILTIRVVGTVAIVLYRFGSLRALAAPCCVDAIMGSRYKLATMSGYVFHNARLYYTKGALKAHGLLKVTDNEGKEYLVYHKIHWLPSGREDLEIVGRLTGEHVDPCLETLYTGAVSICDRKLGGGSIYEEESESEWRTSDEVDELESAGLMACRQ